MSNPAPHTFEVIAAVGGRYIVLVDKVAIAEHSCPVRARAHCERLRQMGQSDAQQQEEGRPE